MIHKSVVILIAVTMFTLAGCIISGRVADESDIGIPDVAVTLSGDADMITTTDGNGKYQFGSWENPLPVGTYTVTPSGTGGTVTPASRQVAITNVSLEKNRDVPCPVTNVNFEVEDATTPIEGGLKSKLGVWEGEGREVGLSWTIKITLTEAEYLVEYPSLGCRGRLALLEEESGRLLFRETITFGAVTATEPGCCDQGFVELMDQDTNTLIYQWYSHDEYNNKGDLEATGTVTRSE